MDIAAHLIADSETAPPDTMGGTFTALADMEIVSPSLAERMKKAVGFRNVAVHNYQAIDWKIVHAICRDGLNDFRDFAAAIANRL